MGPNTLLPSPSTTQLDPGAWHCPRHTNILWLVPGGPKLSLRLGLVPWGLALPHPAPVCQDWTLGPSIDPAWHWVLGSVA